MIVALKFVSLFVFSIFLASSYFLSRPDASLLTVNAAAEFICPSGHSGARLTGWELGSKMPSGSASYAEATKSLKVEVSSVGLPNGTVLSVYVDENRIGDLPPLADGAASVVLNQPVAEGARVRVLSSDRPIVSANLQCVAAPGPSPAANPRPTATPAPTPSPSPTSTPVPSPTLQPVPTPKVSPTATPSPSPSPSPSPTESPTPDPMPKSSPAPSPSPQY